MQNNRKSANQQVRSRRTSPSRTPRASRSPSPAPPPPTTQDDTPPPPPPANQGPSAHSVAADMDDNDIDDMLAILSGQSPPPKSTPKPPTSPPQPPTSPPQPPSQTPPPPQANKRTTVATVVPKAIPKEVDAELDDILAQMGLADEDLRDRALTLFNALQEMLPIGDLRTDPDTVPDPTSPYRLLVGRTPIERAIGNIHKLFENDPISASILQRMIESGVFAVDSQQELVDIIDRIIEMDARLRVPLEGPDLEQPLIRNVVDLRKDKDAHARLRTILTSSGALPPAQAHEIMRFLDKYPAFAGVLKTHTSTIDFKSSEADAKGGGLFNRETRKLHMSATVTPPSAYLRLFLHETGHATFETILMNAQQLPDVMLGDSYTPAMRRLVALLKSGTAPQEMKTELPKLDEIHSFLKTMPPHAVDFYRSWLTLRKDGGRQLLGLNLWRDPSGNDMTPGARKRYQAHSFSEFCAEAFMQYATGDLRQHLLLVNQNPNISKDVKKAWAEAYRVLEEVGGPILGPPAQGANG